MFRRLLRICVAVGVVVKTVALPEIAQASVLVATSRIHVRSRILGARRDVVDDESEILRVGFQADVEVCAVGIEGRHAGQAVVVSRR